MTSALLTQLVGYTFTALIWAIIARALLSWTRIDPYHPAVKFLNQITEPIVAPIRRVMPPMQGLDLSPIVAIFLLNIVRDLILKVLR